MVYVDGHFDRGLDASEVDKYIYDRCKHGGVHAIYNYVVKHGAPITLSRDLDECYQHLKLED